MEKVHVKIEETDWEMSEDMEFLDDDSIPLQKQSLDKYKNTYDIFRTWQQSKNTTSFSEITLMEYFQEVSSKYKPSTLWAHYSMIRTMIKKIDDIDISSYRKLKLFLRKKSVGYQPKKTPVFQMDQVRKFIREAPEEPYLDVKVAAILGTIGACRNDHFVKFPLDHIEYQGDVILVKFIDSKTQKESVNVIRGEHATIFKKYAKLRPPTATSNRFFLNYNDGKCTVQVIGKNKVAKFPQRIADYLGLPNANLYASSSFRMTSNECNAPNDCPKTRSKNCTPCEEEDGNSFSGLTESALEKCKNSNDGWRCRKCEDCQETLKDIFSEREILSPIPNTESADNMQDTEPEEVLLPEFSNSEIKYNSMYLMEERLTSVIKDEFQQMNKSFREAASFNAELVDTLKATLNSAVNEFKKVTVENQTLKQRVEKLEREVSLIKSQKGEQSMFL